MASKDQVFLLNLMETGIISETKYGKTRVAQIKTSVFATSNNIENLLAEAYSCTTRIVLHAEKLNGFRSKYFIMNHAI